MKKSKIIMGSAVGLATIAIAIDHTKHQLPTPQESDQYIIMQDGDNSSPCGMDSSPCGMGEGESPCGMAMDESPCGMGEEAPCGMGESPCGM